METDDVPSISESCLRYAGPLWMVIPRNHHTDITKPDNSETSPSCSKSTSADTKVVFWGLDGKPIGTGDSDDDEEPLGSFNCGLSGQMCSARLSTYEDSKWKARLQEANEYDTEPEEKLMKAAQLFLRNEDKTGQAYLHAADENGNQPEGEVKRSAGLLPREDGKQKAHLHAADNSDVDPPPSQDGNCRGGDGGGLPKHVQREHVTVTISEPDSTRKGSVSGSADELSLKESKVEVDCASKAMYEKLPGFPKQKCHSDIAMVLPEDEPDKVEEESGKGDKLNISEGDPIKSEAQGAQLEGDISGVDIAEDAGNPSQDTDDKFEKECDNPEGETQTDMFDDMGQADKVECGDEEEQGTKSKNENEVDEFEQLGETSKDENKVDEFEHGENPKDENEVELPGKTSKDENEVDEFEQPDETSKDENEVDEFEPPSETSKDKDEVDEFEQPGKTTSKDEDKVDEHEHHAETSRDENKVDEFEHGENPKDENEVELPDETSKNENEVDEFEQPDETSKDENEVDEFEQHGDKFKGADEMDKCEKSIDEGNFHTSESEGGDLKVEEKIDESEDEAKEVPIAPKTKPSRFKRFRRAARRFFRRIIICGGNRRHVDS